MAVPTVDGMKKASPGAAYSSGARDFLGRTPRSRDLLVRVVAGYVVVVVFLCAFVFIARHSAWIPAEPGQDSTAVLIVAFLVVAPLAIEYGRRYFTSLKFGFVELGLRDITEHEVAPSGASGDEIAAQLNQLGFDSMEPVHYVSAMTSASHVIIEKVREIAAVRAEVVSVDLGAGRRWLVPNLYFFALLLDSRTSVKQLVFTETKERDDGFFVGMCPPREVVKTLGFEAPTLNTAAAATDYRYAALEHALGMNFFAAAQAAAPNEQDVLRRWVSSDYLQSVLGPALRTDRIQWRDELTADDLRVILSGDRQLLAAVQREKYLFALDVGRVAIAVARHALG